MSTSLFRRMLVEEYRLHTNLFGPRRFLLFPVFIAALVGSGVYMLQVTGTSLGAIVAGLHGFVLFFGLQVGTLGLVGRDAMRDVLGDLTLLVFSARTLPLSQRRLLAAFLVKDLVYYAAFFLTPVVVGFLPVALVGGFPLASAGLLWVTLLATFALGAGASLSLAGVATRSTLALVALIAAVTAGVVAGGVDVIRFTPWALYADPSAATALTGLAPVVVLSVLGPLLFEAPGDGGRRRTRRDSYSRLRRLPGVDAATVRPLLEVVRSSGSVWKVAFSLGVLFAVTALLLDRVAVATRLRPSAGIAFGTLLGLGTFTTYNWVTQADDPREYLRYPEPMRTVFRGKFRAHLLLAVPVGLLYLALAALWYPPADLLVGAAVFPLVAVYVYGLTAYLTGLSPTELLFDTPLFALFGAGLAALAVPLLVAALAYQAAPVPVVAGSVLLSALAAGVGVVLARRAGPRWHRRMRTE